MFRRLLEEREERRGVGWLVGRLVACLLACLVVRLVGCLLGWLVGWLVESLYSYAGGGFHKDGASTP